MSIPLSIVYQSEHYIAVDKPAGMLVHRSWLDTNETTFLLQTLRNQIGCHIYPIHRLDRPTSGIVLFALNSKAAQLMAQQFEQHQIKKNYYAIVRGWTETQGCINYPLREIHDPIADQLANPNKPAQTAITHYQTVAQTELPFSTNPRFPTSRYSLVKISPQTGRKHQIRRHFKHIFHPIIGDTTHGDLRQNKAIGDFCQQNRLWLHAHQLIITEPYQQKTIQITAPVDPIWQNTCQLLGLTTVHQ